MKKLIIIRGNSGSGKTTLAKELRIKLKENLNEEKVAIIGQDSIRRKMLDEKGNSKDWDNIKLIELNAQFCIENGYITILEGILNTDRYKDMLERLMDSVENYSLYYLDVSFEETLNRHETKRDDLRKAFGENEMRKWYVENDYLDINNEIIIPETSTLEESLRLVLDNV